MESTNVTPEEQRQYDTVALAARKNVFGDAQDDSRFQIVLKRMADSKESLPEAIGGIAAVTMANIAGAVQKKGRQVPGDILFHAGDELVDDLIDVAVAAKLAPEGDREKLKKEATFEGLKLYGQTEMKQGVDPAKKAEYEAELAQLQQGEKPKTGILDSAREQA